MEVFGSEGKADASVGGLAFLRLYSPNVVEEEFSEVHLQDPA
jgi:hypothetical protein